MQIIALLKCLNKIIKKASFRGLFKVPVSNTVQLHCTGDVSFTQKRGQIGEERKWNSTHYSLI